MTISVRVSEEPQILVLSVTRSGQAQLFNYMVNGTSTKPLKPSLNVLVASDAGQKESVQQIPILKAELTADCKMMLAYGSFLHMSIEKVVPDFSDKVQCLIRVDSRKIKEKKEETISKVKLVDTEGNVEYLAPGNCFIYESR